MSDPLPELTLEESLERLRNLPAFQQVVEYVHEEREGMIAKFASVINDGEAKEFAGTTNLVEAGRKLLAKGPKFVIVKRGEHGSYLFGEKKEHFFSCAAYPLHSVFDPTGAGDSFLGGLVGWLAANGKTKPTFDDLKSAVVHGSVVASYTCEAFSTHKLQTVTPLDVAQRIAELKLYTQFA